VQSHLVQSTGAGGPVLGRTARREEAHRHAGIEYSPDGHSGSPVVDDLLCVHGGSENGSHVSVLFTSS
jgi:hypothetical protein